MFNATYSNMNYMLSNSELPLIPLKHEITEMCLIEAPKEFRKAGVTVMCGPFFSMMPFPSMGCHTLSHVRYTPHGEWYDEGISVQGQSYSALERYEKKSNFKKMIKDAARYMPCISRAIYKDSLWEVKTVLPKNESNDGRPILYKKDWGLEGFDCVMGGKIDNVFDMLDEL